MFKPIRKRECQSSLLLNRFGTCISLLAGYVVWQSFLGKFFKTFVFWILDVHHFGGKKIGTFLFDHRLRRRQFLHGGPQRISASLCTTCVARSARGGWERSLPWYFCLKIAPWKSNQPPFFNIWVYVWTTIFIARVQQEFIIIQKEFHFLSVLTSRDYWVVYSLELWQRVDPWKVTFPKGFPIIHF